MERTWRWATLRQDVEKIVTSCDVCQRVGANLRKQEAQIQTIIADSPWEVVTMDFLSGFTPSTPGGWTGCVVVCDRFSRMMHAKECSTHPTAKEAAQLFIQLVVRAHGVPKKIITDRGTQFESTLWEETTRKLGSRAALATTHHPQTNGLTERMNRTLISMIRKSAAQAKDKWVEMLPLLEFAYNNSVHRATTVTPFLANQGSHPVVPASLLVPDTTYTREPREYADWVAQQLKDVWETVRREDAKEAEAVARRENPRRGNPTFQIGDEVMCRRFHLVRAPENKRKQEFTYTMGHSSSRKSSVRRSSSWTACLREPPHSSTPNF